MVGHGMGQQLVALQHHEQQYAKVQHCRQHIGRAPVVKRADAGKKHRRCRPAQITGQTMHTEGMAEPGCRDTLVQNGEVHRVKRGVAKSSQGRYRKQGWVTVHLRCCGTGQHKQTQGKKQHGPCTHLVHQKPGTRLPQPRDHKKRAHQQPDLRVTQTKFDHEHREHQRQQQVAKM